MKYSTQSNESYNLKLFEYKYTCCGCTACMSICQKQAIIMKPDEDGFLYPQIIENICVKCEQCIKVCPVRKENNFVKNLGKPEVYAVKHKNDQIRMTSSSGGMFVAISDYILDKGGVIYGADYNNNFVVCHKRAITKEKRDCLKGSKYVQSDMGQTYQQVKQDLDNYMYVLFTGTSCQVSGLKTYLNKEYERLYTQDLVCHGVPSPKVFEDYKAYLTKEYNSEIEYISFRHKYNDDKYGPSTQTMKIIFKNKKVYIKHSSEDIFYKLFLHNFILRPSCYRCIYTNLQKPGDITLADYWKIEKTIPDFQDGKGISLVLVNTKKGKEMFANVKEHLDFKVSNTEDCIQYPLQHPSPYAPKYYPFWKDYMKWGFLYAAKKYLALDLIGRMKTQMIRLLKKARLLESAQAIKHKLQSNYTRS